METISMRSISPDTNGAATTAAMYRASANSGRSAKPANDPAVSMPR